MTKNIYIYLLVLIVATTSCSGLKKIKSSGDATTDAKRLKSKKTPTFIEGLEITPGSVVKSKHKPTTTKENQNKQDEVNVSSNKVEFSFELQKTYAERLQVDASYVSNKWLYEKIEEWWATRYCMGGSSKQCIDCSAFTAVIAKDVFNIVLLRTAQQQYENTTPIPKEELMEGDLVFFHTSNRREVTHVGVYLQNNKFVHASTSQGVMISDLNDNYWKSKYYASGRMMTK